MEERVTEKPELLFAELVPGRKFREFYFPVSDDLVQHYMNVVGDRHPLYWDATAFRAQGFTKPLAPPGLAAIYPRASYLQDHSMPSGGILVKQEFKFLSPAFVGDTLSVRATVASAEIDHKGRKRVHFFIEAKNGDGEKISEVNIHAIWPK
jgi:acyl dehydratase